MAKPGRKRKDWKPKKLSELSEFTRQFISLDFVFYRPTAHGLERVVYRDYLKTDSPPATELYFNKIIAEKKAERLRNNQEEDEDE